jgi:hypothetical protein
MTRRARTLTPYAKGAALARDEEDEAADDAERSYTLSHVDELLGAIGGRLRLGPITSGARYEAWVERVDSRGTVTVRFLATLGRTVEDAVVGALGAAIKGKIAQR